MKHKKKEQPVITRIEFDENSKEPRIVEVPEHQLPVIDGVNDKTIENPDFVEHATGKGIGKQIAMSRLGLSNKEDENISKRQKTFKKIFVWIFAIFMVGVFVFTFYQDFFASGKDFPDWDQMKGIISNGWLFLLAAIVCIGLYYIFKGLKLAIMCKKLTGKFHIQTCVETGIIGLYYNCITPLGAGGQPFEIYHLAKHGVHGGVASSLPIAAFFTNQFAFVILGIISLALFKNNVFETPASVYGVFPQIFSVLAIIGLSFCLITPLLVVLFSLMPKFGAKIVSRLIHLGSKLKLIKNPKETTYKTIKNLYHNAQCLKVITKSPLVFLSTMILSAGEQIVNASLAFFALKTFGYNVLDISWTMEWIQVIQITLILSAAVSFIPTPGNSGAADLSFYLLFEASLFAGMAFPAMILWRGLSFYSFILVGFVFATIKKRLDQKRQAKISPLE